MISLIVPEKEENYRNFLLKKGVKLPSFNETVQIIYSKLLNYAKSRKSQGFRHGMFFVIGGYDIISKCSYQLNKDSKLYKDWKCLIDAKEDLNEFFLESEGKEGAFLVTKSGFLYAEQQHIITHHQYHNIVYAKLGGYGNLNDILKIDGGDAGTKTSTAMLLTKISDCCTITLGSCSGNEPYEERKLRMFKGGTMMKCDIVRDGNTDELSKGLRYFLTSKKKYSSLSFS
ncbi:MAG: hypothetical protein US31_C0017G0015 [Berkelbacteria bacterium GW2011_GWA1_36_9]|uniref:Uncharacterized protein n=1 Tax=Berkelbacteria bacterium GW2011_GWA1_36_9 TaxID=1618331 RepID=A0A0G0INP4_9BACT|nr:MAG: hypothetical protein US31_C0017G0015 [Berkelbacteria bacterium GW2011_GWA1_36_9]